MSERDEVNPFTCQTEWESVPDENPYIRRELCFIVLTGGGQCGSE